MDADLLEQARTVDPTVLGTRIRQARLARNLTQTAVAGEQMSTAYVSRIEAGQRRPDPELIAAIAARLGVDVSTLVTGTSRDVAAEQRLALDWAELSLRTGDSAAALTQVDTVLAQDPPAGLRRAALRVRAGALESAGRLDDAIILLEDLVADGPEDLIWLALATDLSRAYRVSGDLGRAIDTAERADVRLDRAGLAGTDEATKLMLTLAAAYFERGDSGHAARLCRRAIDRAEQSASPQAKVAAYWNASVIESRRGDAASAVRLASKALAILELGDDVRQLSRLQTQFAIMQLRGEEADTAQVLDYLERAESSMVTTDTSADELASNRVAQARAHLRQGDVDVAFDLLSVVLAARPAPLVMADAEVLLGQIHHARGDEVTAHETYRRAVLTLSAVGADLIAAKIWFELGTLLEAAGDQGSALDAFRRSAASTGVTPMNAPINTGVREPS